MPEAANHSTAALADTMKRMNIPYKKMEGEAAFYGPKIDVKLIDAIGRSWRLTTVQFHFHLPPPCGPPYVGNDTPNPPPPTTPPPPPAPAPPPFALLTHPHPR